MPTTDPEPGTKFTYGIPVSGTPLSSKELRDALEALAQNHYTTDPDYPKTARKGQLRVNAEDPDNVKLELALEIASALVWVTLLQGVQLGFAAPSHRVVQFDTAANAWQVDHNLGKMPLIQAFDDDGYVYGVVGQGETIGTKQVSILHVNTNRVIITHEAATTHTGFVVVIG